MTPTAVLAAQGLVVQRGSRNTVDRLSLRVPAGCVYALLGGNGAGKTTTLNAFLGFVRAAAGNVSVEGIDVQHAPAAARSRLAYLPENVALYPHLSGLENLQYFCALAGLEVPADEARRQLSAAGLQAASQALRTGRYSKGMRQKVGLAIAQARQAVAMLLDEPTSGLDPVAAHDFAQRVRRARDGGMAVLMATHDLRNAHQVADRIGILRSGRLVDEFDAALVSVDALERQLLQLARAAA